MHETTDPADPVLSAIPTDSPADSPVAASVSPLRATTGPGAGNASFAESTFAPPETAMAALYRAALGPVNQAYYLRQFARFDETGRATTSWNWAASLLTVNWMIFRQLWGPALVYLAAAEGLALLMFFFRGTLMQWPMGVAAGVVGTFVLLVVVVPGLYGNALLHADMRRRTHRALAASHTMAQACTALEQRASSPKRLQWLVLANLSFIALGALAYVLLPSAPSDPAHMRPDATLSPSPALEMPTAAHVAATLAASTPTPVASNPSIPASPGSGTDARDGPGSAADSATGPGAPPVAPPTVAGAGAGADAATRAAAPPPAASASAPAPVLRPPPARNNTTAPESKAAGSAKTQPPSTLRSAKETTAPAAAPRAAKTPAGANASKAPPAAVKNKKRSADPPPVGTLPGYYINVGLFANEANARKAQAKLLNEGLPAFRQEIQHAQGPRTRLRVGPYPQRAQAEKTAKTIRGLGLEAVIFKK